MLPTEVTRVDSWKQFRFEESHCLDLTPRSFVSCVTLGKLLEHSQSLNGTMMVPTTWGHLWGLNGTAPCGDECSMGLGTINVGWGGGGGGGRTSVTFGLGESKKQKKKELHGSDCLAFLCFLYPVVFFLCLKVLGLYSAIHTFSTLLWGYVIPFEALINLVK